MLIEIFKRSRREKTPKAREAEKARIEGVNVVYTLTSWSDWDLLQFYHDMGFKKGDVTNLELKIR
jgi:hypothetical protein